MMKNIIIPFGKVQLAGLLSGPENPRCWVIFAHGSGSSHKSPRNNWIARELNRHGFGTLLFDLLTLEEDLLYRTRFNMPLLGSRLIKATEWLLASEEYNGAPFVYFGASTGAGAALIAASADADANLPLFAVISRGGRPDLADQEQRKRVRVPVLLIVGGLDDAVLELNEASRFSLKKSALQIVPGASHLFEEPGALEQVVELTIDWIERYLPEDHRVVRASE